MRVRSILSLLLVVALAPALVEAQDSSQATLEKVMARLDALEEQNRQLLAEVKALKSDLAASRISPPEKAGKLDAGQPASGNGVEAIDERLAVVERRVDEQAQTKVEAYQKLPVRISGMLLFNAFWNSKGNIQYGTEPPYFVSGPSTAGATISQTLLGFDFDGPTIFGGGKVTGELSLDFAGGTNSLYGMLRIRRGVLAADWKNRAFSVGQDKLLVSPRSPMSLAEVSVPPLAGAGNLWIWVPQARYEERRDISDTTGIRLQASVLQTDETRASLPAYYPAAVEPARAGGEGRVELWHRWGAEGRVELAAGAHRSTSHVGGSSVPSFLYSFDGLVRPAKWLEVSGTYFAGQNLAPLSGPSLSFVVQGLTARALRGEGGWLQTSFPLTKRLTLNAFGGWQETGENGLYAWQLKSTIGYAGNLIYRLGPNVLLSAEAGQYRYSYLYANQLLANHYDLAFGYTF